MTEWQFIIVLLSLLLLFFLLWKEGQRRDKRLLLWRLAATLIAVVSLVFLAIPLYNDRTVQDNSAGEAILLTEGYNKDSLDHFLAGKKEHILLLHTEDMSFAREVGSKYNPDISLLVKAAQNISIVHVFGYGLSKEEWNRFPFPNVVFHPSAATGISDIHWNPVCKKGEPLTVQGTCKNPSPGKYKIVLTGFEKTLDSAYCLPNTNSSFAITTIPKGEGRIVYRLAVLSGKDTIEQEPVPVQVKEGNQPRILILSSSPDFEARFLKNAFAKEGYEVAVRTTISKNKYAYDYLNTSEVPLATITSSLLEKFDVVIADALELSHLPMSQVATLQNSVTGKGAGLVVRADSLLPSSFYARYFPVSATGDTVQQLRLFLPDTLQKLPLLNVVNPVFIRNVSGSQSIVQDARNKMYAGVALYGSGKIAFTTLSNTYAWLLSGNEEAYHHFWSALLNEVISAPVADEEWSFAPFLPRVNEPVQVKLQTSYLNSIPQGQINNIPVYLTNHPDLPYQWTGTYWPRKEGWQIGTATNGKPFYGYAFSPADWQNVQASQKIAATQQFILSHLYRAKEVKTDLTEKAEFPKLYFFILFLISAGFLWAESKGLFSVNR